MLLDGFGDAADDPASIALLECTLAISDAIVSDESDKDAAMVCRIRRALACVGSGYWVSSNMDMAARLWRLLKIVSSVLESSSLFPSASDDDLRDSQQYLCSAARLLQSCDSGGGKKALNGSWWSSELAGTLGPPLILLILVMLHSGRRQTLARIAQRIENRDQREPGSQAPRHCHA